VADILQEQERSNSAKRYFKDRATNISPYNRGYATSREQAMTDFKARWLATPRPSFR